MEPESPVDRISLRSVISGSLNISSSQESLLGSVRTALNEAVDEFEGEVKELSEQNERLFWKYYEKSSEQHSERYKKRCDKLNLPEGRAWPETIAILAEDSNDPSLRDASASFRDAWTELQVAYKRYAGKIMKDLIQTDDSVRTAQNFFRMANSVPATLRQKLRRLSNYYADEKGAAAVIKDAAQFTYDSIDAMSDLLVLKAPLRRSPDLSGHTASASIRKSGR